MLASRGFVYRSEESAAASSHRHCDCMVVPGVPGKTSVAGYDPDALYEQWKTGDSSKEKNAATSRPNDEQDELKQFKWIGPDATSFAEKLAKVNPRYTEDWTYRENCQRTVVAYELQCRGYDVTARPYDASDHIGDDGPASWKFSRNYFLFDADVRDVRRKSQFNSDVAGAFDEWGDGARAVVRIEWDEEHGGGGHFVFARRSGDDIIFEDPQIGDALDMDTVMDNVSFSRAYSSVWFMRVDNREVSEFVGEAVQNV